MLLVGPSAFTPPPIIPPATYERGHDTAHSRRVQATGAGTANDRIGVIPFGPYQTYARHRSGPYGAAPNSDKILRLGLLIVTDAALASEPVSRASLKDLLTFLDGTTFSRRPAVFLLDNGNFRVVWKNADNEQAAFQFRGESTVHCVFFLQTHVASASSKP